MCVRVRARISACARGAQMCSEPSPPAPGPTLPALGLPKCLGACPGPAPGRPRRLCGRLWAQARRRRADHWRSARKTGALGTLRRFVPVLGLRRGA